MIVISLWIFLEVSSKICELLLFQILLSLLSSFDTFFPYIFFTESETLEAQALYDFNARSAREINFHKGDTLTLFKQVSNDWWKGSVRGQEGLIPDKYIMLKMR